MAEKRIVITIDENGKISSSTDGIKGETCLSEVQELLDEIADFQSVKKTDEWYQQNELKSKNILEVKKS